MRREPREVWVKRVERWRDSNLSAREFAAELGVSYHTLEHWKYRLAREQRGTAAVRPKELAGKPYTAQERTDIVQAFQRSGLTRQAFCEERGVNVGTLSGWLHKMRDQTPRDSEAGRRERKAPKRSVRKRSVAKAKPKPTLDFVEVMTPSPEIPRLEIELKSGTLLRLPPTFDISALGSLVHALEAHP